MAESGDIQTIDTATAPAIGDGRNRRSERSKEKALAACRRIMMHGQFQPSVVNIARAADLSVRTIFQHFGSVDALHHEAVQDGVVRDAILTRILGDGWREIGGPEEWFDRIVRAAVRGRA